MRCRQTLTEAPEAVILEHMTKTLLSAAVLLALGCAGVAEADLVRPGPRPSPKYPQPQPQPAASGNRDAVALARRDPEIAKMITSWTKNCIRGLAELEGVVCAARFRKV